jgi:CYTH domain-containing protein
VPVPSLELGHGKYAQVERERRFLLDDMPPGKRTAEGRRIVDRYLTGTTLRLRHVSGSHGHDYKFTQKIPAAHPGPAQGLITNTYLSEAEYDLLANLPAETLTKTRHSVPPFGIDVFDPPLNGLVLAEIEFDTDADLLAFQPPRHVIAEVTRDPRFTGGRLVNTTREQLTSWLNHYGVDLPTIPEDLPR